MQYGETLQDLTWISPTSVIYQGCKIKLTKMYDQYLEAKKQNPTALLLFRMGDFYETFFDDAKIVSRVLDLTLTSRNKGEDGEDVPMAGVPYRSINEYLYELVEQGFRVAICDQLEDPALVPAGSIVKRGITQIVTPGTLCDDRPGFDRNARFLTAVLWTSSSKKARAQDAEDDAPICAMVSFDMSTGYCAMTELNSIQGLQSEMMRRNVREVLTHHSGNDGAIETLMRGIPVTYRDREIFGRDALFAHWMNADDSDVVFMSKEKFLALIDLIDRAEFTQASTVVDAFCGLLMYLRELHYPLTANIEQIYPYRAEKFMQIDASTFQNLEIYSTLRGDKKSGSLLGELDGTVTGAGSRLLQNWLAYPLKDVRQINARLDAVEELYRDFECRDDLRRLLREISDLERLSAKIANDKIMPSELVQLQHTLEVIPQVMARCAGCCSSYFQRAASQLSPLEALTRTLQSALLPSAPSNLNDTNFFQRGFDAKLDAYRELAENGQQWLLEYEARQRKETGINSLKVKYQRVFGYFIEVTKANLSLVPSHYIRQQTQKNSERFYTPELKEYEEDSLNASTRQSERELELYRDLKKLAAAQISTLVKNARILAHLDVLCSLAHTAHHRGYTRPKIEDDRSFVLRNARHPVVERFLPKGERFVPNDISLDDNGRLLIITGPNMAGKSTVIRQAAIITLMAQMGSFVPAEYARIGLVDRIFSRVGASDNLALGQSTFMVEMTETSNILAHATDRSLVILDEIGRGTSTYDGLSLAWAIAEYLHTKIGARALFATHYHELTELANQYPGIRNASIAVKEYQHEILFLRKLVDGAANRSYGIQVARLAGIPTPVLDRASQILDDLERHGHHGVEATNADAPKPNPTTPTHAQGSLFVESSAKNDAAVDPKIESFVHDFLGLSVDATTPLQALNWIYKWQKKLKYLES